MGLKAVIGQATLGDAYETAVQATQQAINRLGKENIAFGLVIASCQFPVLPILGGISSLLGETPLLGFSSTGEFTSDGNTRRSIIVVLFGGNDLQARADWWSGYTDDCHEVTRNINQTFQLDHVEGTLLVVLDGSGGDASKFCENLPDGGYAVVGCLAGGEIQRLTTSQIGGKKAGTGGLGAALLTGDFSLGIGQGQAWRSVGTYFPVTDACGHFIKTLDNQPASQIYARYLGYTQNDWIRSPLNEVVHLYPLGFEKEGQSQLLIRSPLRIEKDGSLRMTAVVQAGSIGHLMVGSIGDCITSFKDATRQALEQLGNTRPTLALVFADYAVQMLLESQPRSEIEAIQSILGPEVPIAGGYTFGQIARTDQGSVELLNQHILVMVFGEKDH